MAVGDILISNYIYPYIVNEVQNAQIDFTRHYNSTKIKKSSFHTYEFAIKNIGTSDVRVTNPILTINGVSKQTNWDWIVTAGTVRKVTFSGTSGGGIYYQLDKPVINVTLSNVPEGIVLYSDGVLQGIRCYYQYYTNYPDEPTFMSFSSTNIYEDIIVNGICPSTHDGLLGIGRNVSGETYTIEGSKTQCIIKAGVYNESDVGQPRIFYFRSFVKDTWDRNYDTSYNVEVPIKLTAIKPIITGFTSDNNIIESDITLRWNTELQSNYEIQAYQAENLVYNVAVNSALNSHTIPSKAITNIGSTIFKLRVMKSGNIAWSEWAQITINLAINKPTIINLNNVGNNWEKRIEINWRSEYQNGFEAELYQNNIKVGNTITGTTEKMFYIPENTFTSKDNCSVRVRTKNQQNALVEWSSWSEVNLRLEDVKPTVDNLALSGSNVDLELSFGWTSTDQQQFNVEIVKDTTTVKTYTGTTSTSITIPPSTLTAGLYKFRIKVAYKDRWTEWKEVTVTLVETLPSIGVLEPDGVIVERDSAIRLWWTSQNQSKWKLVIDGATTYTGLLEKEKVLLPASLTTGQHSMILTVTFVTSTNIEKMVTKKAEFIVQGKPPIPTITTGTEFTTSRPTITWDTQDQQGYVFELLKDNTVIYTTEWQNGLITGHKILDYLSNGTYTTRVKVMNQYSIESDWGTKQITVNATESTTIDVIARNINNAIELLWDNKHSIFNCFYVLRNGIVIAKTTEPQYIDYTAHNTSVYTIRGINSTDTFKDSNTVATECKIARSVIATTELLEDILNVVVITDSNKFNGNLQIESSMVQLSGREHPVAIFGEHSTNSYTLKISHCDDLFKLIEMFKRRQVFCYRDSIEKLYFTIDRLPYNRDSMLIDFDASVSATVVDYKESVDYD